MYFWLVIYYIFYIIGASAFVIVPFLFFSLLDGTAHRNGALTSTCVFVALSILLVFPLALTVNGGRGSDLPFYIGCYEMPALAVSMLFDKKPPPQTYKSQPAPPVVEIIPPAIPAAPAADMRPAPVPAPSTLHADFDVPPQR